MKIFSVVGARPQFIKIDREMPNQFIVHTGQHWDYEMSQVFFKERELPKPYVNLNAKSSRIDRLYRKLAQFFVKERPDFVIVYGDTNSTVAGALAAAYANIKFLHVEAGLRSGNRAMPEETNRIIADHLATVRACPTPTSYINLVREGLQQDSHLVGDPLFDAMNDFLPLPKTKESGKYILVTIHRDFNTDIKENLVSILDALEDSKEQFVFPIHPRTSASIKKWRLPVPKNIKIIKPVSYKEMLTLESNAKKIVTDSGGVQREAYWMMIPCIVVRNETEWIETTRDGWGVCAGVGNSVLLRQLITDFGFPRIKSTTPLFGVNKKIRDLVYRYL